MVMATDVALEVHEFVIGEHVQWQGRRGTVVKVGRYGPDGSHQRVMVRFPDAPDARYVFPAHDLKPLR